MVDFEALKTHIAEVERCQQHLQTKSITPVIFLGNEQQAVLELLPDSPRPSLQHVSLQGPIEVDRNGKMSSGRTFN